MSVAYFAIATVSLIFGTLLLRAAVASINWLLNPKPPLIEPSFVFGFIALLVAYAGSTILFFLLKLTMPIPVSAVLAIVAQWTYLGLVLKDHFQHSIPMTLSVLTLQIIYLFGVSVLFTIPFALLR